MELVTTGGVEPPSLLSVLCEHDRGLTIKTMWPNEPDISGPSII